MDAWVDSFAKGVPWHNGKSWILKLPSSFLGQILKIKAPANDVISQVRRTQNLLNASLVNCLFSWGWTWLEKNLMTQFWKPPLPQQRSFRNWPGIKIAMVETVAGPCMPSSTRKVKPSLSQSLLWKLGSRSHARGRSPVSLGRFCCFRTGLNAAVGFSSLGGKNWKIYACHILGTACQHRWRYPSLPRTNTSNLYTWWWRTWTS